MPRFPEISETTLRRHLIALEMAVEQPWRGLDTHTLDGLERDLREMTEAYEDHALYARRLVIAEKDKARFASRNQKAPEEKRAMKEEMVNWMLVWLGDPRMFPQWATLRRAARIRQAEANLTRSTLP